MTCCRAGGRFCTAVQGSPPSPSTMGTGQGMALTTQHYLVQRLTMSRSFPHTPLCNYTTHHGKAFTVLHLTNSASKVVETVHRNRSLHDLITLFAEDYSLLGCHNTCTWRQQPENFTSIVPASLITPNKMFEIAQISYVTFSTAYV